MFVALKLLILGIVYTVAVAPDYNSKILFYHGTKVDSYPLNQAEKLFDNSNFIKSRATVVYFHGYGSSSDTGNVKTIVRAYIQNDGFNILILDWRELAAEFYLRAILGIEELGMEVAKFIQKMTTHVPINKIYLVGHSLGAHLAGYVGRDIKLLSKNSQILPRITGLDPAGPGFYLTPSIVVAINEHDASLVDIIHSDAGLYGVSVRTGTIDFWPNSGRRPQPGCIIIGPCSHGRAIDLWAESVANKGKVSFTSTNEINSTVQVQMGVNCPSSAQPGNYMLYTNSKSPYSLG